MTNLLDLFNGDPDPELSGWDMSTSIGPAVGTGYLLQWGNPDDPDALLPMVQTDAGVLFFENTPRELGIPTDVPRIFQATVIPEPSTALLLAAGLVALGVRRRIAQAPLRPPVRSR